MHATVVHMRWRTVKQNGGAQGLKRALFFFLYFYASFIVYEALRFYCEDGQVGLGPVLSSFQNGRHRRSMSILPCLLVYVAFALLFSVILLNFFLLVFQTMTAGTISGPDALQTISASLRNMIEMGRSNMARYAFMSLDRANLPASLINKPVQRLEWAILVNLIPLFANNEFATIHRELVFGMLETVQSALLGSDDSSILTHGTETIAKQFRLTVMHILQGILGSAKGLVFRLLHEMYV